MNPDDPSSKLITDLAKLAVENLTDFAKKWIEEHYKHKRKKVKEKAWENIMTFINLLAERISCLEEQAEYRNSIKENMTSPDAYSTVSDAIQSSARTENKDKQNVLALLVMDRLTVEDEFTDALILKSACKKIEDLNGNHLRILGLMCAIEQIENWVDWLQKPKQQDKWPSANEFRRILKTEFSSYMHLVVSQDELSYITFVNGLEVNRSTTYFIENKLIPFFLIDENEEDRSKFFQTDEGRKLVQYWYQDHLQSMRLNPIGRTIGTWTHKYLKEVNEDAR